MATRPRGMKGSLQGRTAGTRITARTRNVFFAAYAPAGIREQPVRAHLEVIRANVELVTPKARTEVLSTLTAA